MGEKRRHRRQGNYEEESQFGEDIRRRRNMSERWKNEMTERGGIGAVK